MVTRHPQLATGSERGGGEGEEGRGRCRRRRGERGRGAGGRGEKGGGASRMYESAVVIPSISTRNLCCVICNLQTQSYVYTSTHFPEGFCPQDRWSGYEHDGVCTLYGRAKLAIESPPSAVHWFSGGWQPRGAPSHRPISCGSPLRVHGMYSRPKTAEWERSEREGETAPDIASFSLLFVSIQSFAIQFNSLQFNTLA